MATRRREGFWTVGVIFSNILAISSIVLSFLAFYYEHIRTSEAVDAFVTNHSMNQDKMSNFEGMTFYILLANNGDTSITVSDLWFGFDIGVPGCAMQQTSRKIDEDDYITPILLPSKQASEIKPRFKIKNLPKWEPIYC